MKRLIALLLSSFLLAAAWFAIRTDDWMGASQSLVFESIFLLVGIIVGAVMFLGDIQKTWLGAPPLYMIVILALPFMDNSPVKPAVRAVSEIRPGMTEPEVRAVLDRHFPAEGRFKRPEIGEVQDDVLSFVLDPNDGRYNAAFVQIEFSAGKCLSAEFLAD